MRKRWSGEEKLATGLILTPFRYCCENHPVSVLSLSTESSRAYDMMILLRTNTVFVHFFLLNFLSVLFLVGTEWFHPFWLCSVKEKQNWPNTKIGIFFSKSWIMIWKKRWSWKVWSASNPCATLIQSTDHGPKPQLFTGLLMFVWPHCCGDVWEGRARPVRSREQTQSHLRMNKCCWSLDR